MSVSNICIICGFEATNLIGLSSHIKIHNISSKDYYDKFLKTKDEGFCKTCGKPTNFHRISTGYLKHCCKECISADKDVKHKKEIHFKITYGEQYKTNLQLPNVVQKIKQTKLEKYGDENYRNDKQIKETCKLKYGEEHPWKNKTIKDKAANTCKELYGSKYCFRRLYEYDNYTFDCKWELVYYIYLKDNNIKFEYHPDIKFKFKYLDKIHEYNPDFLLIENNKFIEIKGTQFFENKNPNNKMICSYDRTKDDLYEAKHQCMLDNNVEIITDITLYENYIKEKYGKNYLIQFKKKKKD